MSSSPAAVADPVRVALIGAGRIGTSHAQTLARRVTGAQLVAVSDPRPEAARALADLLGVRAQPDVHQLLGDPEVEAVVISAASEAHADLIVTAAEAGKAIFCEKPMAQHLEDADRAIGAARSAGVCLQVGFNRRFDRSFAAARKVVLDGGIGTPQLMRSLTRDPGLANPAGVPLWTVFLQTLIHDFDMLLWLNPGAQPVQVYAAADALVAPAFREAGLLDTAVVTIRFDNGAIATAEASFSASYGYDVRGEVFGSAGMVTIGDTARTSMVYHDARGLHAQTTRGDVELFLDAYTAEFDEFVSAVRDKRDPSVTGHDARRALTVALGAIESMRRGRPVELADDGAVRAAR
ncbi:Gfo/Idh/MocA family oxidoreductase [Angustibacter sp. McL0619]|uniref:Gfo/Idh/MocA family oxidoreductase n=1 Tax=Angustibacter sp. McL0619 TaxID=3415676 RepID=UPI003CED8064